MPIFLCYDPYKRSTSWTQEKHQSMVNEFAKRRIKYLSVSSPEELESYRNEFEAEHSSIVFFPASENERQYLFDRYGSFPLHKIIFSHHDVGAAARNFSSVMSDFYGDMEHAISHLRERGCKRIALFNANPSSYHDRLRIETYKHFIGEDALVFTTQNKIYPSITALLQCHETIDAIICINDFVAFCLILFLDHLDAEWQKKIALLSFSNSILSGLCSPSLTSISLNYIDGGKEVATIHKAVEKNPKMAYMHVVMKSTLYARETSAVQSPAGICFAAHAPYDMEQIKAIIAPQRKNAQLEKLLRISDETDLAVLHGLILENSLSDIANRLYLTRDTIKYRVRKFKDMLQCESAKELSAFLRLWIDPKKLEEMIVRAKKN